MTTTRLPAAGRTSAIAPGPVWALRTLLAALLLLGATVLLWAEMPLAWWRWPLSALGALCVAALLLDVAVRARVLELFGLLALAGLGGVTVAAVLFPANTFADMPNTLATRGLGAHTLAALGALLLLRWLLKPSTPTAQSGLVAVGLGAGLAAGVWTRAFPATLPGGVVPALWLVLAAAALWLGVAGAAYALVLRGGAGLRPADLALRPAEAVVVGGVLAGLGGVALARGAAGGDVLAAVLLAGYCGLMLWFGARRTPGTFLAAALPPARDRVAAGVAALATGLFVGGVVVGYRLVPPPTDLNALTPASALAVIYGVFGLVWLPVASIVLGVRAYRRTTRTG